MPASIPPLAPLALPALPPPLSHLGGVINEKAFRRGMEDLTPGSERDRPRADAAKPGQNSVRINWMSLSGKKKEKERKEQGRLYLSAPP